jgi:hypothetical protein
VATFEDKKLSTNTNGVDDFFSSKKKKAGRAKRAKATTHFFPLKLSTNQQNSRA